MQRWVSGVWRWSVLATKQNVPSVNIVRSSPKTDWLRAAWKPNGKNAYAISLRLRRNCSGGNNNALAPSAQKKKTNPFSRFRYEPGLGRAYHHGSRSQRAFARSAGRSDGYRRSARTSGSSYSALARRHSHGIRPLLAALPASWHSHRRRYYLLTPSPRRSLFRRCHRWHPESPRSQDGNRRTFYGQSGRQPAPLSKHSSISAAGGTTHWGTGDDSQGGGDPGHQHFHYSSLAE